MMRAIPAMVAFAKIPRLVWLGGAAFAALAALVVVRFLPDGNDEPEPRRPVAGDRIAAVFVFAPKWAAGKLNDALVRYRFADSFGDTLHGSFVPHDDLPQVVVEYFRGDERIAVDQPLAWCTRSC